MIRRTIGNIFLALILALFSSTVVRAASPSPIAGKAVQVEGNVEVSHDGQDRFETLEEGSPVFPNDRIKTRDDSRAKILFPDDSIIVVGPESEFQIGDNVYSSSGKIRQSFFKLVTGKIRVMVTRHLAASGSKFEIQTNTAITGVRGTHFVMEAQGQEQTNVYTIEGKLNVHSSQANIRGEVNVSSNMMTQIKAGLAPSPPEAIPSDMMENLLKNVNPQSKRVQVAGPAKKWLELKPGKKEPGGATKVFSAIFRNPEQSSPKVASLPLPKGPEGWRAVTPWNPEVVLRVQFPTSTPFYLLNNTQIWQILGSAVSPF